MTHERSVPVGAMKFDSRFGPEKTERGSHFLASDRRTLPVREEPPSHGPGSINPDRKSEVMKECCAGAYHNEYCSGPFCCQECADFKASLERREEPKPMKKARIKGTEFELKDATQIGAFVFFTLVEDEKKSFLPPDWIEFYDPPREEPPEHSVEQGVSGTVYHRINSAVDGFGMWYSWVPGNDAWLWKSWSSLQVTDGPTKPMKVVDEQA